jgi:hydroxyacylglutathione hydrolase
MRVRQFVVDGLGHLSTLIADDASGVAAVVDPRRDVDVYLAAARADDLRITHVIETHLHNDYVSGGRELSSRTGAQHVIGRGAELAYEHRGLADGEAVAIGRLRFTSLDTPGHTPEHVSYAVADRARADEPALLFTGGSLLVGAVGRTDLLGDEHAVPYARQQFRSVHDVLLAHQDHAIVFPTHGAGSLCSTGIASTPFSTIGYERRHNPMLQPTEFEAFARVLLDGQPAFPAYFARMRPTNRAGPGLLPAGALDPRPLDVEEVRGALASGALVIDLRSPGAHAAEHIPGSLSIPSGSSFGTWLGWVVDPDRPLVLLLEHADDWDDAIRQALRVGYERVVGHLHGGVAAWGDAGGDVASLDRLTVHQLAAALDAGGREAPLVIDVRQRHEYDAGHVPGALHLTAGDLPGRLHDLPRDRTIATICASGYRASVAASLLRQAGVDRVAVTSAGVPAWSSAGYPRERA